MELNNNTIKRHLSFELKIIKTEITHTLKHNYIEYMY